MSDPLLAPLSYDQAIDVSWCQSPSAVPWARLRDECRVRRAIARVTHGDHIDTQVDGHIQAIEKAGLPFDLYAFFLPSVDPLLQASAAILVAQDVEHGRVWVDVEPDGVHAPPVTPAWCEPLRALLEGLDDGLGKPAGVYVSQLNWLALGAPSWVLERPLWVPHYTERQPLTPGGVRPELWQWTGSRRTPWGGPSLDWSAIIT